MAMAGSRFGVMLVVLGLLAMIQQSTQLSLKNPLHDFIDRINLRYSGSIGLVLSTSSNEKALNESNAFVASSSTPYVDVSGRRFHIGTIGSANVVYVVAGSGSINTALTVQILVDGFAIEGIVYVGTSGSVNSSLSVGDVVVPKQVAYTGAWTWQEYENSSETLTKGGKLYIGDYNLPTAGENSLGTIEFDAIQVPSPSGTKTLFWLPADASWLSIAEGLQSTLKCEGGRNSNCLSSSSNIVFGLRGVSANIYVKNSAYGKFLKTQFKASIVDEGTAPVAVAARSNGKKVIFIRGVSNIVGGSKSNSKSSSSASANAVNFATKFIEALASDAQQGYYKY